MDFVILSCGDVSLSSRHLLIDEVLRLQKGLKLVASSTNKIAVVIVVVVGCTKSKGRILIAVACHAELFLLVVSSVKQA